MLSSGTKAVTTWALPRVSVPWIWPRRLFRSPMTSPMYSSGVSTSTFMIGSSSFGAPFSRRSRNAARLELDLHAGELAGAAGLLLVGVVDVRRLTKALAVGHLRRADVGFHLVG